MLTAENALKALEMLKQRGLEYSLGTTQGGSHFVAYRWAMAKDGYSVEMSGSPELNPVAAIESLDVKVEKRNAK